MARAKRKGSQPAGLVRLAKESRYVVHWRDSRGRVSKSFVVAASKELAAKKVKRRAAAKGVKLDGVRPHRLYMAEFLIGRGVGHPIGTVFEGRGGRCVTGTQLRGRTKPFSGGDLISLPATREQFLAARAEQVGPDATGATIAQAQGVWMGGKEPSVVASVMWMPWQERDPKAFINNMGKLGEALACRLSQKEVLTRISRPGKPPLLLRSTPTGAPKP